MNQLRRNVYSCLFAIAALLGGISPASAQVSLGAASGFAVLGGSNVTCTSGVIAGSVGVAPGSAVPFTNTGCTITGATPPATDAAAVPARADFLSAFAAIQSMTCIQKPGNLSGESLPPGVYCTDAVAKAGTLTLAGPSNGVWVFRVAGALTGTNFSVAMPGGGQPCNVFWAPTGAATMTDSALKGNILAGDPAIGSITLTRGTLAGRALANVAVTMTGASIIGCSALSVPPMSCKDRDRDHDGHHKGHAKCDDGHDRDKGHGACKDGDDDDKGHQSDARYPFESKREHGSKGDKGGKK